MAMEDAQRLRHVEQEQATLRSEMKGLAHTQAGQGTQLNRIEQLLLNKPPMWNTNTVLSLVLGVAGVFYGASQYVGYQVQPLEKEIVYLANQVERLNEISKQTYYEMGRLHFYVEKDEGDDVHLDARFHSLQDRVRITEREAAAASVSRKAIGNYSKETRAGLDNHVYPVDDH
jgi:hypothetical protein